jgi:hypothetical protein
MTCYDVCMYLSGQRTCIKIMECYRQTRNRQDSFVRDPGLSEIPIWHSSSEGGDELRSVESLFATTEHVFNEMLPFFMIKKKYVHCLKNTLTQSSFQDLHMPTGLCNRI